MILIISSLFLYKISRKSWYIKKAVLFFLSGFFFSAINVLPVYRILLWSQGQRDVNVLFFLFFIMTKIVQWKKSETRKKKRESNYDISIRLNIIYERVTQTYYQHIFSNNFFNGIYRKTTTTNSSVSFSKRKLWNLNDSIRIF